jgi:hypothetical protein
MPAQITERPKRRNGRVDTTEQPAVLAQILQFPTGGTDDPDAATALARIVQSLDNRQSRSLGREIGVLSAAIAQQVVEAEPVDAPEGLRPRHSERCCSQARRRIV